ncbi:glycerophosphodiester phosphodiesterase [Sporosarcina sp. YIM B06819]|uniref:glycerophosphodiester phosphodiesterase n=1 Tax=Sporosarcina sp. YIM B06819 TaxID=3081769 RepID=UPI00298D13B4|nr:glycerophosphodiester phosphodiesterase family protein [Sporosarcina sp. YIM B06819]
MSKPAVFAHRGASAVRFENTMSAFEKALMQGADGIELDVQVTEDGVPIVIHDADLVRLAGVHRTIATMTSAEVAAIRVGKKYARMVNGHQIPTLTEVAMFSDKHGLALNVELKETVSERPESIERIVDSVSHMENLHFSSFDYRLLEKIKAVDASIETAYLVRKNGVDWDHLEQYASADGFHLHKRLLQEPYVSKLIQSGKKIRVYGMTGQETIVLDPPPYIAGWITDYPDRF